MKPELEAMLPRVDEVPFDSERKRMTTVHRLPQDKATLPKPLAGAIESSSTLASAGYLIATKGAMDSLLQVASHVWDEGRAEPLDDAWRERIVSSHDQLAQQGMRVLGVAVRPLDEPPTDGVVIEKDLIFVGLAGMIDPPRPEVKEAIHTCNQAGLRALMITGDHPLTAQYIAHDLGITSDGKLLTGRDLDKLSDEELEDVAQEVSVYARVSPEHKLKIVGALQDRGQIVAMTGDGVNDAPALRKADIGVAMGITGTDVSKEASDMVLQDDNFATIVAAIAEGRVIFDNIRKFLKDLLLCNSGELWVMLIGPFLGMPLPLLPLQILWMNLVTDGLPALALAVEPAERDTMRRPPYPPGESMFARRVGVDIVWIGLLMGVTALGLGFTYWRTGHAAWQTVLFTNLVFSQIVVTLTIRSQRDSLFTIGVLSNKPMIGAVLLSSVLQLAVIYVPFLQGVFGTEALAARDLGLALLLSTIAFWGLEIEKWVARRRG